MRDIWSGLPKEISLTRKKKYIFGTTISSFSVFLMSLNENIYIEGFIFNSDNLPDRPFNKEVIRIENIPEDSIILVPDDLTDSFKTLHLKNCCEIHKVYVHRLSDLIREKEIYIWGTGNNGLKTFRLLAENNVRIKGFIDSDIRKKGERINGLPVSAPECIDEDAVIVIASRYYKQIIELPDNQRFQNLLIDYGTIYGSEYPYVLLESEDKYLEDIVWNLYSHFFIFMRDVIHKNVIIYGYNKFGMELKRLLSLMDKQAGCFIEDEADESADDIVRDKFDILYENTGENIILISKFSENAAGELICDALSQLEDMGLNYNRDFKEIKNMADHAIRDMRISDYGCKLDPMLGYTLVYPETSETYRQYVVLGDEKDADLRIMILGGSTSDIGQYKPEKSWPEFLFEKLNRKAVVFGGAAGGYNSRQECLKLLRDIGTIRPDIVISYSGINDAYPVSVKNHPFIHTYQSAAMKNTGGSFQVDEGPASKEDHASLWLRMELSMHAVARAYGCRFYGILQPAFYSKKLLVKREKLISAYGNNFFSDNFSDEKRKERYEQILNAFTESDKLHKYEFLYNLSNLFLENKDEIFKDCVHLFENGNELVAEAILEIIQRP